MKLNILSSKIILLAGLALSVSSCTGDFRDMNTNDHEATDDMLDYDNLRIGNFITAMERDVFPTSDEGAGDYQIAQNLTGDIFSGYMGAINDGFKGNNHYNLSFSRWNDRAFEVAFTKVMPAWKQIVSKTDSESIEYALAQVLKVAALHRLADNYGPLPYTRFGKDIYTPYDSQEELYMTFFKELDEAIGIMEDFVSKTPNARPLKDFDLVYEGDFTKWLKFANSLKLRLAMRVVYVDENLARTKAAEAVKSGVMTVVEDGAMLKSVGGMIVYNPLKKIWDDYSDTRMGANMESFLKGFDDGRIEAYFRLSTLDDHGYHGVRNGITISKKSDYTPFSIPNFEASSPVRWMCAAEVYFLRAEGVLRGWTELGSDAQALYEEGIKLSFQDWKANMRSGYLTDRTSKAAPYTDPVGRNNIQEGSEYLSTITIAWDSSDSFEKNLERIITQKWIAMFPDGQEAWTEFRRTGYPKIFPVIVNNSYGTIDTKKQIRRITFPQSEYDNNQQEVEKAVSLLGGPDTGGTNLWWDKKNNY